MSASLVAQSEAVRNGKTFEQVPGVHPLLHAKNLDRFFGYRIPKIEVKLQQKYRPYYMVDDSSNRKKHYQGTQTWIGLHPQVLLTPYNYLFEAFNQIKDHDITRVVDIGAGYGRVGMVMNAVFPNARFIGYEILKQRADEANRIFDRLDLINCEILLKNVLDDDFILPRADVYFMYDFSEMNDVCQILDILVKRAEEYNFLLITKGEGLDYLLEKKYKDFWVNSNILISGELKIYRFKNILN